MNQVCNMTTACMKSNTTSEAKEESICYIFNKSIVTMYWHILFGIFMKRYRKTESTLKKAIEY